MGPCVCGCAPEDHDPECHQCDCIHYEEEEDGDWPEDKDDAARAAWLHEARRGLL